MSSSDDASFRLSSALEGILSGNAPAPEPTADWSVDDEPTDGEPTDGEPTDGEPTDGGPGGGRDTPEPDAGTEPGRTEAVDGPVELPVELPVIVPATSVTPIPEVSITPTLPASPTASASPTSPTPTPTVPTTATAVRPASSAASPPVTAWGDHMTSLPTNAQGAGLRAPGRRPRVRRVTRVLRHIDPWSTFKVGLLFSAVAYVVFLTSGVLLWRVADSTGTLDNVERWFTQFGWETFELKGGEVFHNAWIIGLFGIVALTGGLVLLATLFNLVSDIVGGVRMTVLEEEVVERTVSSTRRYVVRRPPAGAAGGVAPATGWDVDGDDPVDPAPGDHDVSTESVGQGAADWSVDDEATAESPVTG